METKTVTLTDFLLARIAEDEEVAIATRDAHDPLTWDVSDYGDTGAWGMGGPVDGPSGYASIIVAPARVLAECEAKRRIVAYYADMERHEDDRNWDDAFHGMMVAIEDGVLPALAAPYADHPDYREEWRS